jgi:glycine reductase complex component B subunit gamma
VKVVHYVNQFFAGLGGEEAATAAPARFDGPRGPGKGLAIDVALTLACGDDRFAEDESAALGQLLAWLDEASPDVLVCGPSFAAGRYGYACGVLAREAAHRGIPVVAGMHPESPGVLAAEGAAYIVPTGTNVADMRAVLPRMAGIATRLAAGETLGSPEEEGYLPRGLRRNRILEHSGAERSIELILAKLEGDVRTEVAPTADLVPPPEPIADVGKITLALVTEAGCVPQGNPDRLPSRRAHSWLRYPLQDVRSMDAGSYQTVHAGFDTRAANADPNRLVPLDAVRELEREGRIGRLHDVFYTTTGVDTPVAAARRFGQEIGKELREAGVEAVLLTGT